MPVCRRTGKEQRRSSGAAPVFQISGWMRIPSAGLCRSGTKRRRFETGQRIPLSAEIVEIYIGIHIPPVRPAISSGDGAEPHESQLFVQGDRRRVLRDDSIELEAAKAERPGALEGIEH